MSKNLFFSIGSIFLAFSCLIGCNNTPEEVKVKFDTDGGTIIDDIKINKGEKVTRPTKVPKKDNCVFTDWYTSKEGEETFNFENAINTDTTIYAHYKEYTELKVENTRSTATYQVGERFNYTDIKATAVFSDGTTRVLEEGEYTSDPELPYKFSESEIGKTVEFTITCYGKSAKISANVTKATRKLDNIVVEPDASHGWWYTEQTITGNDFKVTAYYDDQSSTVIPASECTVNPELPYTFVESDVGPSKTFTFSYTEGSITKTYDAQVLDIKRTKKVTKIEATSDQSYYSIGYTFTKEDVTVKAYYDDGTSLILSKIRSYTIDPASHTFDSQDEQAGSKEFTVSFEGVTCKLTVSVLSAESKFYEVYSKSSSYFQQDPFVYNRQDLTYTYKDKYGKEQTGYVNSVTYDTVDGVRSCDLNVDLTTTKGKVSRIGGGEFTYYDDATKGIKKFISDLKGKSAIVTFGSDSSTGKSWFSYKLESTTITYRFGCYGHLYEYVDSTSSVNSYTIKYYMEDYYGPSRLKVTVDQDVGVCGEFLNPSDYPTSLKTNDHMLTIKIKKSPSVGNIRVIVKDTINPTKYNYDNVFEPGGLTSITFSGLDFRKWTGVIVTCQAEY